MGEKTRSNSELISAFDMQLFVMSWEESAWKKGQGRKRVAILVIE